MLRVLALQILALNRPPGRSGCGFGQRGTAGLAARRTGARLRMAIAVAVGALIGPSRIALRRGRAIRIGRTAVAIARLGRWRRRWPFAGRPGLGARSSVPIRGGPIQLAVFAFGLTLLAFGPLLLAIWPAIGTRIRALVRAFPHRRTRGLRFGSAFGGALPLRRLGLALGRGLRPLPRRWCGPFRARLRPVARCRRAGPLLRRMFRPGAAVRRLAAPGPAVLRTTLSQQDPPR